jgi:hypothetical protein
MVEEEDTGWLAVLEKKGLHQAAEILDNYGINSETDVSVVDRDDFCSWCREDSSRWKQRSWSAGVTLCVHVPRTRCLRR